MKKNEKVTLIAGKQKKDFVFIHAERILNHVTNNHNDGWKLPKDSKFEFKNNELRTKSNKGSDKAPTV